MRFRNGLLVFIAAAAVVFFGRDWLAPYLPDSLARTLSITPPSTGRDGQKRTGSGGGTHAVTVTEAKAGDMPILRNAIGTIVPVASTALSSLTSGTVSQIVVQDGDEVKAGDLLVQLDDRTVKADIQRDTAVLAKDQAALDEAESTLKRVQTLTDAGAETQQQYDDASAAAKQAQAAIAVDRANLAADEVALTQTQIRAPFDGKLGVVQPSLGAVVSPGAAVVTITQMKPVYAEFVLPETDLDLVRSSLSAGTLSVQISPTLSNTDAPRTSGPVVFIDNMVDAASGTFKLRARLDNADGILWPGQALDIAVHAGEKTGLAIVPAVAVQPQSDGSVCFVVGDDKTVRVRKVEIALTVGDMVGISGGLKAGESVVTEGQSGLVDGAQVSVVAVPAADPEKTPTGTPVAGSTP